MEQHSIMQNLSETTFFQICMIPDFQMLKKGVDIELSRLQGVYLED